MVAILGLEDFLAVMCVSTTDAGLGITFKLVLKVASRKVAQVKYRRNYYDIITHV